jgi:outer membrane autotransporter protein
VAGFFLGCKLQIGGCKQPSVVENSHHTHPPLLTIDYILLILNRFSLLFRVWHALCISMLNNLQSIKLKTGEVIVNLTKSKLHIAVLAALPLMAIISMNAKATDVTFSDQQTYPSQSAATDTGASTINSYTGLVYDTAGTFINSFNMAPDLSLTTLKTMGINIQHSNVELTNNGAITITGTGNYESYGIFSDRLTTGVSPNPYIITNVEVTNNGAIEVSNGYATSKRTAAVQFKEELGTFTLTNNALLSAKGRATNNGTATSYFLSNVEGIYTDDNLAVFNLTNGVDGTISTYTYTNSGLSTGVALGIAVYNRAPEFDFINRGIINGHVLLRGSCESATECDTQTFTNYRATNGDLMVYTVANGSVYGDTLTTRYTATGNGKSEVSFKPVINGDANVGAGTSASPYTNIGYIGGRIKVVDLATTSTGSALTSESDQLKTAAQTLTITPQASSTLRILDDKYYKVATTYFNGASDLPMTGDNGLVSWTPSINGSSELVLKAEVNADNVTDASVAAKSALTSLMEINGELTASVQNLETVEDVREAGEQLRAEANNASYQAVVAAANHVSSVIGLHQDQVRAGATGVSSGEAADGAGFWLEAFGFRGDQKERSNVDGYQADTGGFVLGGDKAVGNGDARVGAAFAYGSTGINGKGANTANRTDIDSYQGIFYGSYNAGAWYADASLGYGRHQYDTKRVVSLVGANLTGSHNANQYSAKLGFGLPIARGNTTITPLASLAYVKLDQNGYTESDRNDTGAALSVDSTKTESLRSGLGAKLSVALATGELSPTLEARAVWNHEFADTNQNITASFDDGDSFTTNGVSQSRDSANLGVGLNLKSKNGQTLSVNYDAEVKNDYVSHTAALKARFDF